MSRSLRHSKTIICCPSAAAAACKTLYSLVPFKLLTDVGGGVGIARMRQHADRRGPRYGAARSSSRFATSLLDRKVTPVTFAPGR